MEFACWRCRLTMTMIFIYTVAVKRPDRRTKLYECSCKTVQRFTIKTSCRRSAATICLRPLHVDTISSYLFARWHLFRHVGYLRHQQQVDVWPFDFESGVRVTCDVGYLCANFGLPRPLCSRVTPDIRDRRQTKASLRPIGAEA